MRRHFIVFFFTLLVTRLAAASGDSLEAALNHQYKNQTYSLRVAAAENSLHYDSSGNLLSKYAEGPWTVYGRLNIRKIKLKPGKLIIEGQRIGYLFDKRQRKLAPYNLKKSAKLEIALDQPLASAEAANELLARIFAFSKEDFLVSASPIWRPYLESYVEIYSDDGRNLQFKQHVEQKQQPPSPPPQGKDENGVYRFGNGVKAPVPLSTPDPDYSDIARSAKFQATNVLCMVVDENGKVANLELVQPAGLGLDEKSISKVQTWTFRPATKDGQPVKVLMMVEVSFNLY